MNSCTRPHTLVTGASTGIGRATALQLAASGHHVYAGVRQPADGTALVQAAAGAITPLLLDVTDAAQIGAAAETVAGHVAGTGLDGLVNNAGVGVFGPLEIIPVEQFRALLEVNVTGQLAVTQTFLPLLRQARGRIIMIGSIGTRFTPPFVGALAASKSALVSMDEALRQELAPWDIHVVLVEPATVRSEAVGKLDRDAARLMSQASPRPASPVQGGLRALGGHLRCPAPAWQPAGSDRRDGGPRSDHATATGRLLDRQGLTADGHAGRCASRPGARRAAPQARPSARTRIARGHPTSRPGRRGRQVNYAVHSTIPEEPP